MATRCIIKIEGEDKVQVYKHWDGYPEAMKEWLEKFNKEFTENRGNDVSYKFAQLLRHSTENSSLERERFTGWGVIDIEDDYGADYEYILKSDGSLVINRI